MNDKARAEKQARMVAKSIITGGVDMANMGANSFFYEASESLLASAIMILSEYGEPGTRHVIACLDDIERIFVLAHLNDADDSVVVLHASMPPFVAFV